MATFVLVGGFWLGAWSWNRVTQRLRERGHDVWPQTLTGLGDRIHLAGPDVGLATQIGDVVNAVERNDLRDVTLVGHSGGGIVISGAVGRLNGRVSRQVYVDSGPFPDGASVRDSWSEEERALFERLAAEQGDGWRVPLPAWDELNSFASLEGIDAAALLRWRSLAAPQPLKVASDPLSLHGPAPELPSTLIACSIALPAVREMIAAGHPWFAALSGSHWTLRELATGHWPMFSRPDDLAAMLHDCAAS